MRKAAILAAAAVGLAVSISAPAQAGEVYGGVYVHAVDTPFTFETGEGGVDFQLGYRFDPIDGFWDIEPYVIGSLNSDGDTSFAGVGISKKLNIGQVYLRPGVGVVVHDAPSYRVDLERGMRTDLGSRVLLEPEIALGTQVSERVSFEASWVHVSHARIFDSGQNPGIDMMGLRVNVKM